MKKIFSALFVMALLSACASSGTREPVTLNQAMNAQITNPERALVFMTVSEATDSEGVGGAMKEFFLGGQKTASGITFAGSPYDPNNKNPTHTFFVADQNGVQQAPVKVSQGTFSIMERKNWAYVYPAKYAVNTVHSKFRKAANMGGWARSDGKAYLAFDVLPGEMVYLGHLRIDWQNELSLGFVVEDRFADFRQTLPAEIRDKVKKRLVKAPPAIRTEAVRDVRPPRPTSIPIITYR